MLGAVGGDIIRGPDLLQAIDTVAFEPELTQPGVTQAIRIREECMDMVTGPAGIAFRNIEI